MKYQKVFFKALQQPYRFLLTFELLPFTTVTHRIKSDVLSDQNAFSQSFWQAFPPRDPHGTTLRTTVRDFKKIIQFSPKKGGYIWVIWIKLAEIGMMNIYGKN